MLVYPYLPLYNYLTGTLSPSRYDFSQPGMNTDDQAQEIIFSLTSGKSVLLQPDFTKTVPHSWPETSLSALVKDRVGEYIARNYRICKILSSPDNTIFLWMIPKGKECR